MLITKIHFCRWGNYNLGNFSFKAENCFSHIAQKEIYQYCHLNHKITQQPKSESSC